MAHDIEEGSDGLYTICVFNAENHPDDEIQEIFGTFGEVMRITRSGNTTFLRYQTREEAVLCYESMQGDARFNVRPGKKKFGSNNPQRKREGQFGEMNRNDNQRGRRPEMGGGGDFGRSNGPGAGAQKRPPKLIPFPAAPKEEGATVPPPSAKVVVMANLHPKMGQNSVYSLCGKVHAPPLHVAMKTLKRPPYPNISYAFIYVRNASEAESIISSFNNLKLNGYKLVVSSADKLSEEGKALLSAK